MTFQRNQLKRGKKKKNWLKGVERKSSCYVFVVSENICDILETEI